MEWNIEKLYIVKKSNIKEHIVEGLKPYKYFIIKMYFLPDYNIYLPTNKNMEVNQKKGKLLL